MEENNIKNLLIVTGGSIQPEFAQSYLEQHPCDYLIAADHGLDFCKKQNMLPDLVLGDFDSVETEAYVYYQERIPERMHRFPSHKDETDTELALLEAIARKPEQITILGATGTRVDHMLANIQLLELALKADIPCYLVDDTNRISMRKKPFTIKKKEQFGHYLSLMPYNGEVTGLTIYGTAYDVINVSLHTGKSRGISNEIIIEEAAILIRSGILLVIEAKDQ